MSHIFQISEYAVQIPPLAWFLAAKFLPGAITIVLYKSSAVSNIVTGGSEKVGLRVPAHPVPIALIEAIGAPLVGTSANVSGRTSALTAGEVLQQIGDRIDFIIDGGRVSGGIESTVVDVTGENPVVLREGAISINEIESSILTFDPKLKFIKSN